MPKPPKAGYGNPPAQHRFKKGVSGNPKGRPRGAKNLKTLLREVLEQPVKINAGDVASSVTMRQAILLAQAAKAAKGDVRAASLILSLDQAFQDADPNEEPAWLSTNDEAILKAYLKRHRDKETKS